ncbi:uncharacterized protein LOC110021259 [Phalaenopsis equestris]|uniref:uncharacterized protein LOC110021259 n=1 Tax=Phalaenopsis equestris TaxID=78828 RepID=UPI0009E1B02F|nr:uncharacterized protein LOC110021259 [Phalaenopsis equestris]
MCPLRVILIFLSATLAGFFVLKGLRSHADEEPAEVAGGEEPLSLSRSGKVRSAMSLGFWTCVDMASGRYLWRNLVSSAATVDSGKKI